MKERRGKQQQVSKRGEGQEGNRNVSQSSIAIQDRRVSSTVDDQESMLVKVERRHVLNGVRRKGGTLGLSLLAASLMRSICMSHEAVTALRLMDIASIHRSETVDTTA